MKWSEGRKISAKTLRKWLTLRNLWVEPRLCCEE